MMPTNINIPDPSRQMYGQFIASSHLDTFGKLQWNRTWSGLQDSRSGLQLQQAESLLANNVCNRLKLPFTDGDIYYNHSLSYQSPLRSPKTN